MEIEVGDEKVVVFCATQRSGSAMIVDDFYNLLGGDAVDAEIIFTSIFRDRRFSRWTDVWRRVRHMNRVGDIVAVKVMSVYTPQISDFMEGRPQFDYKWVTKFEPEKFFRFHQAFRRATFVHLQRDDVFAQAVSLYLAIAFGRWEKWRGEAAPVEDDQEPTYDRARLMRMAGQFIAARDQWDAFYAHFGVDPVRLRYETAVDNFPNYLDGLFARLGVRPIAPTPERRMLKVGNAANLEWAKRLRQDWIAEHGQAP